MQELYHGLKTVENIIRIHGLVSINETIEKQEGCVPDNKSTSGNPPWSSPGVKPKSKSLHCEMGGRVTGRAQRPEICDATGWPALSSRQSGPLSTPLLLVVRGQLRRTCKN
ncbi:uncharacterized protein LOC122865583 [Scomber scombrus]|uniref:Uncharacterized protein LOC122865583 n=1 Tax=Scomber scombrus TaxID=13677 RepID=A0AAV1N577_SCOSC